MAVCTQQHDVVWLQQQPNIRCTVLEAVQRFPPHGPFLHLALLNIVYAVQREHGLVLDVEVVHTLLKRYYNLDHLRHWAALHQSATVNSISVDAL